VDAFEVVTEVAFEPYTLVLGFMPWPVCLIPQRAYVDVLVVRGWRQVDVREFEKLVQVQYGVGVALNNVILYGT